jgi:hypothetical protein
VTAGDDLDLTLDQWAACAAAALDQLQDEIDALDAAGEQRVLDAILRKLGEPEVPTA